MDALLQQMKAYNICCSVFNTCLAFLFLSKCDLDESVLEEMGNAKKFYKPICRLSLFSA